MSISLSKLVSILRVSGPISLGYAALSHTKRRLQYRINRIRHPTVSNPNKYTYIDPEDIEYYLLQCRHAKKLHRKYQDIALHKREKGYFRPDTHTGIVLSGDWDLYKKAYEFDWVYKAYKKFHEDRTQLLDTEHVHQYQLRSVLRDADNYVERQIREKESLYEAIREDGFKTQYELGTKGHRTPIYRYPWSITVNIGRDGEVIFNNTAHNRLAASKVLGLDEIPVLVVVRHSDWQEIREEIRTCPRSELSERARKHLEHPDVQEFVDEGGEQARETDGTRPLQSH